MSERVVLNVGDMRKVVTMLLDHLESIEGHQVVLEHEMFWSIPAPAVFDVYSTPDEFTIGQLSELWENLRRMTADGDPVSFGLVWLGDLLRAIGIEVVR